MSISHKSTNQCIFRLMLYRRALHPELFNLRARRTDRHGEYEVESWITQLGHLVRFQVDGKTLTEVCLAEADHLPENGLVHALPCLGEKDYELEEPEGRINYVTTIQTETLTDNLYAATHREMLDFARETGSIYVQDEPTDGSAPLLCVLDTQKYKREFHVQSYHLLGASGTVLRTQSIFEIVG